jgi:hypothetical protein
MHCHFGCLAVPSCDIIRGRLRTRQYHFSWACQKYPYCPQERSIFDKYSPFAEPPVFLPGPLQLKSVNKTVGDDVHYQCEVKAKPSAKLDWLINNEEVTGGSKSQLCLWRFNAESVPVHNFLVAECVEWADNRLFRCVAFKMLPPWHLVFLSRTMHFIPEHVWQSTDGNSRSFQNKFVLILEWVCVLVLERVF